MSGKSKSLTACPARKVSSETYVGAWNHFDKAINGLGSGAIKSIVPQLLAFHQSEASKSVGLLDITHTFQFFVL